MTARPGGGAPVRRRDGVLCRVIAAAGTPATVVVATAGSDGAETAGVSAIVTITLAAFAAARALLRGGG